jgi:pyruvate-formate lyase-activating enzyme
MECTKGLDQRFDRQRGHYRMTFASRGCPVNCSFCIVPRLEGLQFTLDWQFVPAPVLCDNNLSALPTEFQEHIIRRYIATGTRLLDANSGFEPRTFDKDTLKRWTPLLKGPWRFAYDEASEDQYVRPMMALLADVSRHRKRVYVLLGNEPMAACLERARKVIEWGGEPFCQPVIKLNSLDGRPWVRFDWTTQRLKACARYFNRHLWKYIPLSQYRDRKHEPPPFAGVDLAEWSATA